MWSVSGTGAPHHRQGASSLLVPSSLGCGCCCASSAACAARCALLLSSAAGDTKAPARIGMIKPAIAAKVRAAHDEESLRITGETKAVRNVAEHALFGEGAEALPKDGKEAKRRQRGRRRAGAALRASACSSPGSDEDSRELETKLEDGDQKKRDKDMVKKESKYHTEGDEKGATKVAEEKCDLFDFVMKRTVAAQNLQTQLEAVEKAHDEAIEKIVDGVPGEKLQDFMEG
ncbi:unnamed protein product [Prorocentrum cordatum]|uniref:Uncharacterized protein n=1 Tax=Prorocentrum cordatum TaxID=2364126 RepID=A0ABN9S673_9DINO|nr:unnamed protein product [Polarella glacialis]